MRISPIDTVDDTDRTATTHRGSSSRERFAMCRSSADGGRRCSGSSAARRRALGAARKQVERARKRLTTARASGDPSRIARAAERLATATQRLADTHAAHPAPAQRGGTAPIDTTEDSTINHYTGRTTDDADHADHADDGANTGSASHSMPDDEETAGQQRGHDTAADEGQGAHVTNHATVAGVQTTGDVDMRGGTVVVNGNVTGNSAHARRAAGLVGGIHDQVQREIRRAQQQARQAQHDAGEDSTAEGSHTTVRHHADGSTTVHNYSPGPIGIQAGGRVFGNTIRTDRDRDDQDDD